MQKLEDPVAATEKSGERQGVLRTALGGQPWAQLLERGRMLVWHHGKRAVYILGRGAALYVTIICRAYSRVRGGLRCDAGVAFAGGARASCAVP